MVHPALYITCLVLETCNGFFFHKNDTTLFLAGGSHLENFPCQLDDPNMSEVEDSCDDWIPELCSSQYLCPEFDSDSDSNSSLTLTTEQDMKSDRRHDVSITPVSPCVTEGSAHNTRGRNRRFFRADTHFEQSFSPKETPLPRTVVLTPSEYIQAYISDDLIQKLSIETQKNSLGTSCIPTDICIRKFIGMSFIMAILKLPRINMYWSESTRIPMIANSVSRDNFINIRKLLKPQDNMAPSALKKQDRFWQIRPFLNSMKSCFDVLPRPAHVTVYEMIVPFKGRTSLKMYVPKMQKQQGIKMFVLASADGIVLDFEFYQGRDELIHAVEKTGLDISRYKKLSIGEAAILRFVKSVAVGTSFYFSQYFTTTRLLEILTDEGMGATGTIKRNNIPNECRLEPDRTINKLPRGTAKIKVRYDGAYAVVVWKDNKPLYLVSNQHGIEPTDICQRWSKKSQRYLQVVRPNIIKQYSSHMKGVYLLDQLMSHYKSGFRSHSLAVRIMFHMLDLACVSAWNEYRQDCRQSCQKPMDSMNFKLKIGESLIKGADTQTQSNDHQLAQVSEVEERPHKKQRGNPIPDQMMMGAAHLPVVPPAHSARRQCRRCRTRTRFSCTACNEFLCINPSRNCFALFHISQY